MNIIVSIASDPRHYSAKKVLSKLEEVIGIYIYLCLVFNIGGQTEYKNLKLPQ